MRVREEAVCGHRSDRRVRSIVTLELEFVEDVSHATI